MFTAIKLQWSIYVAVAAVELETVHVMVENSVVENIYSFRGLANYLESFPVKVSKSFIASYCMNYTTAKVSFKFWQEVATTKGFHHERFALYVIDQCRLTCYTPIVYITMAISI